MKPAIEPVFYCPKEIMLKRLAFGLLLSIVLPLQADILIDHVHRGGSDYECYAVDKDGVERFISTHSKRDKATAACDTEKIKAVLEGDTDTSFRTREQGYTESVFTLTPAAEAQLFPFRPRPSVPDPGDPDAPPAGWAECTVGAVTSSALSYDSGSEVFTVGVNGGSVGGTADAFVGYCYQFTGDATITAQIASAVQVTEIPSKAGIFVRETTAVGARHNFLNIDGANGIAIDRRSVTDQASGNVYNAGPQAVLPVCLRVAVDVDLPSTKLYLKTDGADCSTGTYVEIDHRFPTFVTSSDILFVLATTPNSEQNATSTFDQVVVSTAAVDHAPGEVGFAFDAYLVDEDDGTVTLTVTRNGSGSGACSVDYATVDDSALAGTNYTGATGTVSYADSEIGDKTFNVSITDIDGVAQGNKQFDVVLTENDCPDTLSTTSATVTINDLDVAGFGWEPMGACTSILPDWCIHGVDWSAFIATDPAVVYRHVTNRNNGGAGSLEAALTAPCAAGTLTAVIPRVSGYVIGNVNDVISVTCSNLLVLMQVAPSPGLHRRRIKTVMGGNTTRQLWMHDSCIQEGATTEAASGCVQIGQVTTSAANIIHINPGAVFNADAGYGVFKNADDISYVQGIITYPTSGQVAGENPEGARIGGTNGSTDGITFARNVMGHTQARTPRWIESTDGTISNNIAYNSTSTWASFDKISDVADINWIDNVTVKGPQGSGRRPLVIGLGGKDQVSAAVDLYAAGNCAFGLNDGTQAAQIEDNSGGDVTFVGALLPGAINVGYVSTEIGACGDANERQIAELICKHAGPRPADPGRANVYKDTCAHVLNHIDGVAPQGSTIGLSSDIGYQNFANNECDPFVAGSCGAGFPALPPAATVTPAQILDYAWETHCLLSAAGATGC